MQSRCIAQAALGKTSPQLIEILAPGLDSVCQQDGIARLDEIRVGWTEIHAVGEQLQHQFVAFGKVELPDELGAHIPQSRTPEFANIVWLVGILIRDWFHLGINWPGRAAGNTRMQVKLHRVNVFKGQRGFADIGRVRVTASPVVIILGEIASARGSPLIKCISSCSVCSVQVIRRLGQQSQRVKVRPSLAKAQGYLRATPDSTTHPAQA